MYADNSAVGATGATVNRASRSAVTSPTIQPVPLSVLLLVLLCAGQEDTLVERCRLGHAESCLSLSRVSASGAVPNAVAAFDFAGRACALEPPLGCMDFLDLFRRFADHDPGREEGARSALEALERLCRPEILEACRDQGEGLHACRAKSLSACRRSAVSRGRGIPGVVEPDPSAARTLLQTACSVDDQQSCETIRWAAAPPLTQDEIDEVRHRLVRSHTTPPPQGAPDHQAWCIALGRGASIDGNDPDPSLMARLTDLDWVHPVSWCRARGQGNVLALGPVVGPGADGPGVSTWIVSYAWDGMAWSKAMRIGVDRASWKWPEPAPALAAPAPAPGDATADRQAMESTVRAFVEAWNRGDSTLPGLQPGDGGPDQPREHTRLHVDMGAIKLSTESRSSASVEGQLLGMFEPRMGTIWPTEPWKQNGARSPVLIYLRRTGGWWRKGQWQVSSMTAPWISPVILF
jgi:hypothetical protein